MFSYRVALQGPGNESAVLRAIRIGAAAGRYSRLRASYAYASVGGATDLVQTLGATISNWEDLDKKWLVSIDFGHTDPGALELLASLPNSEVRVPYANALLASARLTPKRTFHPKTLILYGNRVDRAPVMVALGSANMTISGLRSGHEDVSVATWTGGRLDVGQRAQLTAAFDELARFDRTWRISTRAVPSLIDAYRAKRPNRPNPEDTSVRASEFEADRLMPSEQQAALQSSTRLWVEVNNVAHNLGPGKPGNQIHFRQGTRAFFGLSPRRVPKMTQLGTIMLTFEGRTVDRHMRYSHNGMDTLDLPLPGTDGPATYEHTVLEFRRTGPAAFELRVANTIQSARWKAQSLARGTLYKMSGGRHWGVLR